MNIDVQPIWCLSNKVSAATLKTESRYWINLRKLNLASSLLRDWIPFERNGWTSPESPIKDGIAANTCLRTRKDLLNKAYNYFKPQSFPRSAITTAWKLESSTDPCCHLFNHSIQLLQCLGGRLTAADKAEKRESFRLESLHNVTTEQHLAVLRAPRSSRANILSHISAREM